MLNTKLPHQNDYEMIEWTKGAFDIYKFQGNAWYLCHTLLSEEKVKAMVAEQQLTLIESGQRGTRPTQIYRSFGKKDPNRFRRIAQTKG